MNLLILLAFSGTILEESTSIQCDFPGEHTAERTIQVRLEPRPSLKDQPELFRVIMEMNGVISLRGTAQPIRATKERDVMIRGLRGTDASYTLGLREDGQAAIHVRTARDGDDGALTRTGACEGYEAHIERWLR